jgi:glucose/arabinose dehydrogenase
MRHTAEMTTALVALSLAVTALAGCSASRGAQAAESTAEPSQAAPSAEPTADAMPTDEATAKPEPTETVEPAATPTPPRIEDCANGPTATIYLPGDAYHGSGTNTAVMEGSPVGSASSKTR